MMKGKNIPVVLICDDGYILPTCVAISSIISSKNDDTYYDIYIVCASLTEKNESVFAAFATETVAVHIIREDAYKFVGLHEDYNESICAAPPSALLKFILADIFPDYDKILYLDGDILVKTDLTDLYRTELGNNLAGVIFDSSASNVPRYQIVPCYFNSGVMLLNINQMRLENTKEALIKAKTEHGLPDLMDQDAFNYAFDGRIYKFPIRYNLLAVILDKSRERWTPKLINKYYGTEYTSQDEIFRDGAIIHFAGKIYKPWKDPFVIFADEWFDVFRSLPEDIFRAITDFDAHDVFINNIKLSKQLEMAEEKLRTSSPSYRIGRAVTWLPRKIRGSVRCFRKHGFAYTIKIISWQLGVKRV